MISVTDTAAEKINQAIATQDIEGKTLRLGVFPGGCSGGYQYALGFDDKSDNDMTIEANGLKVLVKNDDMEKVKGTEIDYVITEMGEGFRVNNPNPVPEGKKGECGCGSSTSCC
ncbi:MAG: iron-sulfur cluster assembly accessory protein [Candidatus Thermoplasmatota archaeon]|nr:iron-sulfur cluster assembly accessory protein [Candidatus Thermoplasmatota archaeon]